MPVQNRAAQELALLQEAIAGHQQSGEFQGGLITGPILDAIRKPGRERQQKRQRGIEIDEGQTLFSQQGFSAEQQQDPRVQAVQTGLADPGLRERSLAASEDLQAEFGINQPLANVATAGAVQDRLDLERQRAVATEERTMRGAWQTAIRPTVEVLQSVDTARNQMQLGSPEASLNSARLFIQQLDKSMITNPEIANVIAQQGLSGRLSQILNWSQGGGSFDEPTRKRMLDSMVAIGEVYKEQGDFIMQQTQELASRNPLGINPENVTSMGGFANREFDLSFPGGKSTGQEDDTSTVVTPGAVVRDPNTGVILEPTS